MSVSGDSDAKARFSPSWLSVSPESDTLTARNPSAVTSAVCSLPDACTCPRMPGSTTTCAVRGAASISAVRLLSAFDCANSSIASPDEIISTTAHAAQYSCTATVDAIATTASRSTPTCPCRRSSIMPRTVTTIVYATNAITIHCPTPGLNALNPSTPTCEIHESHAASPHGFHSPSNANGIADRMVIGSNGTCLHSRQQISMILRMRISLRSYRTPC